MRIYPITIIEKPENAYEKAFNKVLFLFIFDTEINDMKTNS